MAFTQSISKSVMAVDEQSNEVNLLTSEKEASEKEDIKLFDDTPHERQIARYFETLNSGDFRATAQLFADDGTLYPPFESRVIGPDAIALYLEKEARGLQLFPQRRVIEESPSNVDASSSQYAIFGSVQTSLLSVNVRWTFVLNSEAKITSAEVKLMADLKELLTLNRKQPPATTA